MTRSLAPQPAALQVLQELARPDPPASSRRSGRGVSRHLRILHQAGLVGVRADGQRRLHSLRPAPFREIDEWLTGYRNLWEARPDQLGAALAERRSKGSARKDRQ